MEPTSTLTPVYTDKPRNAKTKGDRKWKKRPKRVLDQVCDALRVKHCSIHTEVTYVSWIKHHILFHNKRPPKDILGHSLN
ncbi:MAG: phage integrase N-terminal SAM-like domain-containing protein [Spirochaetota bacterium]|nr:phage integrase N-terminal SAM-like domain-containing protein [Spirochaetota bacterium]